MIDHFAAALIWAAAALAQAQTPPPASTYSSTPETRDADCFLVTALGSQNITANRSATAEARQVEPLLRATANYFAGRLSTRLSGDPLQQALQAAAPIVQRPDLGPFVVGCTEDFQNFMRGVSATPRPAG